MKIKSGGAQNGLTFQHIFIAYPLNGHICGGDFDYQRKCEYEVIPNLWSPILLRSKQSITNSKWGRQPDYHRPKWHKESGKPMRIVCVPQLSRILSSFLLTPLYNVQHVSCYHTLLASNSLHGASHHRCFTMHTSKGRIDITYEAMESREGKRQSVWQLELPWSSLGSPCAQWTQYRDKC